MGGGLSKDVGQPQFHSFSRAIKMIFKSKVKGGP